MLRHYSDKEFVFLSSPAGGSHYLLLDEISLNLHQHGHEVRMLLQLGNPVISGKLYMLYIHKHTCTEKYFAQLLSHPPFSFGHSNFYANDCAFQDFLMQAVQTVTRQAPGP